MTVQQLLLPHSHRHRVCRLISTLLIFVAIGTAVWAEEGEGEITADLNSPQATVRTFFEAMGAVQAGNEARLLEAIACIYIDESLEGDARIDRGTQVAYELFDVLSNLRFAITDIPDEVSANNYLLQLGEGDEQVTLKLHFYEDKKWRFSSSTVDEDALKALKKTVVVEEGEAAELKEGFEERLKSPRAAVDTFLRGMNGKDGLTQEDALTVLDLAHLNKGVRQDVGMNLAVQLKAVLDRTKRIELSELPPESERPAYTLLRDPAGAVVLNVIADPETGIKAWKFTQETLERVEDLYLKYKDRALVEGVAATAETLSLSIRLRDWMYDHFPFLLRKTLYLQNWQWGGLFAVILLGMLVSRIITFVLIAIIRRWFQRARLRLNAKLEKDFVRPIRIAMMAWFWLLGLTILGLPAEALLYLRVAAQVVSAAGAIWATYRLIDIVGEYLAKKAAQSANKFDDLLVPITTRSLKIFVIAIGIVVVAKQAGQDPTAVLTGLGLGGLAFALAAKDVVANIFGSFTILMDRPFQLGDWVSIGSIDGSVESVGIRSTRIRTFYNSLITVPNSELINQHVDNMGARRYRRIKTNISVTYDTPPEKIEAFCEGIRELIRKHPYTRKDYYHCYLNQFAPHSLDILLYCFVETPEWATELRERHRLFVDIMRLAKRLGVEFAFPTQTLYMRQDTQAAASDAALYTPSLGRKEGSNIAQAHFPEGLAPPPVQFSSPEGMQTFTGTLPMGEDQEE